MQKCLIESQESQNYKYKSESQTITGRGTKRGDELGGQPTIVVSGK